MSLSNRETSSSRDSNALFPVNTSKRYRPGCKSKKLTPILNRGTIYVVGIHACKSGPSRVRRKPLSRLYDWGETSPWPINTCRKTRSSDSTTRPNVHLSHFSLKPSPIQFHFIGVG